jgi:hypothetical protein
MNLSVQQLILTLTINPVFGMVLHQSHLLESRGFYKTDVQFHMCGRYIFLLRF